MWNRCPRPSYPPTATAGALPAGLAAALALSLVLTLPGCQAVAPPVPGNFTTVTLEAVGGEQCVETNPEPAEIWSRETPGKPHQVRWVMQDGGTPYRWVIDFKNYESEKDHFGQRVVPCRAPAQAVTSGLPRLVTHSPGDRAEWTYRVTLMSCEPGAAKEVCEADPVVIIRDVHN